MFPQVGPQRGAAVSGPRSFLGRVVLDSLVPGNFLGYPLSGPRSLPESGTPASGPRFFLGEVCTPGQDRGYVLLPSHRNRTDVWHGWYASCAHVGGLSCLLLFYAVLIQCKRFHFLNWVQIKHSIRRLSQLLLGDDFLEGIFRREWLYRTLPFDRLRGEQRSAMK